jgi:hypothetical protein
VARVGFSLLGSLHQDGLGPGFRGDLEILGGELVGSFVVDCCEWVFLCTT